jgi:nucleoside-diphosphate-sugar epimerase
MQRLGKPRILIVGCGDVGLRLLPQLTRFYKVFALTSSGNRAPLLRQAGAIPVLGDLDRADTLWRLPQLASRVIHLAPPPAVGQIDTRTHNLLRILSQGGGFIRQLIYISTTGVYGDCGGAWIDETSTVNPQSLRAKRRVSAEAQIRAWGVQTGISTSILRVPGIYAQDRLPIERIRRGTPALLEPEDVYTNHIHADDLARLIKLAIYRAKPQRVVNACDDSQLKMGDYFDAVAKVFQLPCPPRVGKQELEATLDPIMLSFMSESRRISNHRLRELGFGLQYPTVNDYLEFTSKYLLSPRND